jgi:hypothetical protein
MRDDLPIIKSYNRDDPVGARECGIHRRPRSRQVNSRAGVHSERASGLPSPKLLRTWRSLSRATPRESALVRSGHELQSTTGWIGRK